MGKYGDLVRSSWNDAEIFAESIPHLLHWDLAYRWILEKPRIERPSSWSRRIEAWRYLVSLLVSGGLALRQEELESEMLRIAKPYGITRVTWVHLKNGKKPVGVISPTVLVRPLPDFNADHLREWQQQVANPSLDHSPVVGHFVHRIIKSLSEDESQSIRTGLARILEDAFTPAEMPAPPQSVSIRIPLLTEISWVEKQILEDHEILIGGGGGGEQVFLPRCRECNADLLQLEIDEPISVELGMDAFAISCSRQDSPHDNEVKLSSLLLWQRNQGAVVSWHRDDIQPRPTQGFPPPPTVSGSVIRFDWDQAIVADPSRRMLKLRFSGREITQYKVSEIIFRKLLVPGKREDFCGLPFKRDWIDALSDIDGIEHNPTDQLISYSNLAIKGLPDPIVLTFPSTRRMDAPNLGVGIFPNPEKLPPTWLWYRAFLDGPDRKGFEIEGVGKTIFPGLSESHVGVPEVFSIINGDAGVSYRNTWKQSGRQDTSALRVSLGIDFGTTNTVIYFLPPGTSFAKVREHPAPYCINPQEYQTRIGWLARATREDTRSIGGFLPHRGYGPPRELEYIIPTVLWEVGANAVIRWNSTSPDAAEARPLSRFKLDPPGGVSRVLQRKAFLEESLLLSLPLIVEKLEGLGLLTSWNLQFKLGFSYPLAMRSSARNGMRKLLDELCSSLRTKTGFTFDATAINESGAIKELLGAPLSTDTFLVADMGGSTIDLALFTASNKKPDQIGSIQFAGETVISGVAEGLGIEALALNDAIRSSECRSRYGSNAQGEKIIGRFMALALDYLRTMIEAYRKERPQQRIKLVLSGNGWHLVEHLAEPNSEETGEYAFREYFSERIQLMGLSELSFERPLPKLPNSKHLVATGALQHASEGETDELSLAEPVDSSLPAGLGVEFVTPSSSDLRYSLRWFDLVGAKLGFTGSPSELLSLDLKFNADDIAPTQPPWKRFLEDSTKGVPPPDESLLRKELRGCIPNRTVSVLEKGPLQLILETHWANNLRS